MFFHLFVDFYSPFICFLGSHFNTSKQIEQRQSSVLGTLYIM